MDWIIIYQSTTILAGSLLAIVVAVFVLASSLLGLAVDTAAKEEEENRAKQEKTIAEQVAKARKEFNKAAKGTKKFEQTEKALKDVEKQLKRFEKETRHIRRSYQVFTAKGGVLYPGIPLFLSLILSVLAWGFSSGTYPLISPYLWGVGVAALGFSLYRIYFGLKRIESVGVTSEQAAFSRMTRAFGVALEKHEEERKPQLGFVFRSGKPPFHCKKESTLNIRYTVELSKGDIARQVAVWFFAPQGFSFPDRTTWFQEKDWLIPSACTCIEPHETILLGTHKAGALKLKVPTETGTFTLGYRLYCEGYTRQLEEFEVVVE